MGMLTAAYGQLLTILKHFHPYSLLLLVYLHTLHYSFLLLTVSLLKVLCADVTMHCAHQERHKHPDYQHQLPAVCYKQLFQLAIHWQGMVVAEID